MSFSWAETITQNAVTVKASHANELRTNINSLRTSVGLSAYSWSKTITQYDSMVEPGEFMEMRTALDGAAAELYHHTVYGSYLTGYCTTQNSTYYYPHISAYYPTYYAFHNEHVG